MSEPNSSPFIEHPRSFMREDGDSNNKQSILSLQYLVSTLETEKKLLQQEKESVVDKYEALLTEKNEQLETIQDDFDFLYKQRQELQSKYDNFEQTLEAAVEKLQRQSSEAEETLRKVREDKEELENRCSQMKKDNDKMKMSLEYEKACKQDLEDKISVVERENKRLGLANDELLQKLQDMSSQMTSASNGRFNATLQNKVFNLQMTNNQLQLKIDQLLQQKTSAELLKQKNLSLTNKLASYEELEERYYQMEIDKLELENKFDTYFKMLSNSITESEGDTNETKIIKFITNYNHLQNENLVLQDKYSEAKINLRAAEDRESGYRDKIKALEASLKSLEAEGEKRTEHISKLERQKILNVKEIQYLRNLLKKLDEINMQKSKEANADKSLEQYLSNLEKLVDDYRTEINNLQTQLQASKPESKPINNKRPKIVDDSNQPDLRSQLANLEKENFRLLSTVKDLESNKLALNEKLQSMESLQSKRNSLRVLQLKANPVSMDQLIKQTTLDLLRKENESLLQERLESSEVIPKSVFERQENDKAMLQTNIDQLKKRITRLREVYSQKSRDILSVISKFFGFTIEFLPSPINANDLSSRIKLVSKYMINREDSATAYLILDIESKSLKANGSLEFKELCEDLVTNWIRGKDQIPCFLSALNLSIYEMYVKLK